MALTFNTLTRGAGLITLATVVAMVVRGQTGARPLPAPAIGPARRSVATVLTRWAELPPYRGHPD